MSSSSSSLHIPLQELPLRPSTLNLLQQRGFHTVQEVLDYSIHKPRRSGNANSNSNSNSLSTLAAELDMDLTQTSCIVREVTSCLQPQDNNNNNNNTEEPFAVALPPIVTAHEYLAQERKCRGHIVTFCKRIDTLLGGGISLGSLTELAGLPGTGKTQLAMQLCVNARLPTRLGGVQGQAIYIDAEGSLATERLYKMAQALTKHVQGTLRRRNNSLPATTTATTGASTTNTISLTPEQILDSIHVLRVHDETAQTATLYSLPHLLEQLVLQNKDKDNHPTPPVKLIVIDSIAFHYRAITPTDSRYYLQRTKALTRLAAFLGDLASTHHLAVVAVNQMTTKIDTHSTSSTTTTSSTSTSTTGTTSRLVPALGESWAHATTTRILLSNNTDNINNSNGVHQNHQHRTCTLVKSPHKPSGTAEYQVVQEGIRDVPARAVTPTTTSTSTTTSAWNDDPAEEQQHSSHSKRARTHS